MQMIVCCCFQLLSSVLKVIMKVFDSAEASGTDFLNTHNHDALAGAAGLLLFLLNCFAHAQMCHV